MCLDIQKFQQSLKRTKHVGTQEPHGLRWLNVRVSQKNWIGMKCANSLRILMVSY